MTVPSTDGNLRLKTYGMSARKALKNVPKPTEHNFSYTVGGHDGPRGRRKNKEKSKKNGSAMERKAKIVPAGEGEGKGGSTFPLQ